MCIPSFQSKQYVSYLTVNVKKKKHKQTMVLQQRNINSNTSVINFKGNMIQNVSEYKLSSLIKSNGNLNHSLEDLAKKAQKVFFSIKSRVASLGNIPIKVSNNLFDKLITLKYLLWIVI